jgi:uncharacterized membrane protein
MAGIGFELRKLLSRNNYLNIFQAYAVAGLISTGPLMISILGIFMIGLLTIDNTLDKLFIGKFQVSITYLMACSLIFTSPFQFMISRYIADRHYEKNYKAVLPNIFGVMLIVTVTSGLVGIIITSLLMESSYHYSILLVVGFVILSNIWIIVLLLSALKEWKSIVLAFFVGYTVTVVAAYLLSAYQEEGLLAGFILGHAILMLYLLRLITNYYSANVLLDFDFIHSKRVYYILALTGLIYNIGIWADKFLFWFNPDTSEKAIGFLRYSPIYDLPIFLAYLSIIPGMAVLLVRIETDFVEKYKEFYDAINGSATLDEIKRLKSKMIYTIKQAIYEIFKVQGMTVIILIGTGEHLLKLLSIPEVYKPLLSICLIGVGVQVVFMSILNVLFYFDQRMLAFKLSVLFLIANVSFTAITQYLGPSYYGYGFVLSLTLSSIVGFLVLSRKLDALEYETYMIRSS